MRSYWYIAKGNAYVRVKKPRETENERASGVPCMHGSIAYVYTDVAAP